LRLRSEVVAKAAALPPQGGVAPAASPANGREAVKKLGTLHLPIFASLATNSLSTFSPSHLGDNVPFPSDIPSERAGCWTCDKKTK
jgi:hypothetical protein